MTNHCFGRSSVCASGIFLSAVLLVFAFPVPAQASTAPAGEACSSKDSDREIGQACDNASAAELFPEAYAFCAAEHFTCAFIGTRTIAYGANGRFVYKVATGSIACDNQQFGDPAAGVKKACYIQTQSYSVCAHEGETCRFGGVRTVAYGAKGQFIVKEANGDVPCSDRAFGQDPIPGTVKSCYIESQAFVFCASEQKNPSLGASLYVCRFDGTRTVAYGADGHFVFRTANGLIACRNGIFGDPAPGVHKACYVATPAYRYCARQYEMCQFAGTRNIAYGAENRFTYLTATNGVPCNNSMFGNPLPGTRKACYVGLNSSFFPKSYTFCASENNECRFSGERTVEYGANHRFVVISDSNSIACSNSTFGDPVAGVIKSCYLVPQPYTYCAGENDACRFSGTKTVAYGGDGRYVYWVFSTGEIACNADSFCGPGLKNCSSLGGSNVRACYLK
jgi:hypothetical protein